MKRLTLLSNPLPWPPVRPALLIAACIVMVAATAWGCYPHQGRPYRPGSKILLEDAARACARLDERAAQTLLRRIVARHPGSHEADLARRALGRPNPCPLDGMGGEPPP